MSDFENIDTEFAALASVIGNRIVSALPPDWRKLWIQVEIDTETASMAVFYASAGEPEPMFLVDVPDALFGDFRNLQEAARRVDAQSVWTTATYTLDCDGRCNVDYGYEPIPIEAEIQRRRAWKIKYLSPPA